MSASKKIMIIAHGHPDFSKGGAEIAAYNMAGEYTKAGHNVLFVAREQKKSGDSFPLVSKRKNEILLYTNFHDYFTFTNQSTEIIWREFKSLLDYFQPDIVHIHHYIHLGLELFPVIKNYTAAKIFLTLHEYAAICNNNGQMIKKTDGNLCKESSNVDCNKCFPSISPGDFFLRKKFIQAHFEVIDHFISPSQFLKDRYISWGIHEDKISVIENGQIIPDQVIHNNIESENSVLQLGFFGQLNPYKGIDILLEAMKLLPRTHRKKVHLNIFGANLHIQEEKFQHHVNELITSNKDCVSFHGSYDAGELSQLMNSIDWVVVPSIWWENSPMVIQEAFMHKKPVLCSDIGGMKEKVKNNITGLHFMNRKPIDLMNKIIWISDNRSKYNEFVSAIRQPLTVEGCAAAHMELYDSLANN